MRWILAALTALSMVMGLAARAAPGPVGKVPEGRAVDLQLVLAVDSSASISSDALEFQLRGHAEAFRNPAVTQAIVGGPAGAIAVTLVIWDSPGSVATVVPWRVIASAADAAAFADAILAAERREGAGSTAIGSAIDQIVPLFGVGGFRSSRMTIDLCSNGFSNSGVDPAEARDRAAAAGATINALAILDEYPWLEEYYLESVIGGPGAFVKTAEDRESFAQALLGKLVQEIVWRPSPPSRVGALDLDADTGAVGEGFKLLDANADHAHTGVGETAAGDALGQGLDEVDVAARDDIAHRLHECLVGNHVLETVGARAQRLGHDEVEVDPDRLGALVLMLVNADQGLNDHVTHRHPVGGARGDRAGGRRGDFGEEMVHGDGA